MLGSWGTVGLRLRLSLSVLSGSAGLRLAMVPAARKRTMPDAFRRRFRHSGGMRNRVREVPAREAAGGQSVHGAKTLAGVRAEFFVAADEEQSHSPSSQFWSSARASLISKMASIAAFGTSWPF